MMPSVGDKVIVEFTLQGDWVFQTINGMVSKVGSAIEITGPMLGAAAVLKVTPSELTAIGPNYWSVRKQISLS